MTTPHDNRDQQPQQHEPGSDKEPVTAMPWDKINGESSPQSPSPLIVATTRFLASHFDLTVGSFEVWAKGVGLTEVAPGLFDLRAVLRCAETGGD